MRTVKVNGMAPGKAPAATNYADVKGQGPTRSRPAKGFDREA